MSEEPEVYFEVVVPSESGVSMFDVADSPSPRTIQDTIPTERRTGDAARALVHRGFRVVHVGVTSISGSCSRELWENTFQTTVVLEQQRSSPSGTMVSFWTHVDDVPFIVPDDLAVFVERAYPQRPPKFFGALAAPVPPALPYLHLRVPDDVATVLRAAEVHRRGFDGTGQLVVMVDSGFASQPFHRWHGYICSAMLGPDTSDVDDDPVGHGTGQTANAFSTAPGAQIIVVKMSDNPTAAFKAAVELAPSVISLSWGFELGEATSVPNFLRPLEVAVDAAVNSGIIVCCSGGNGEIAFPAAMPSTVAVGGVHASPLSNSGIFTYEASDFVSSFDSLVYPGRHVPDLCGLSGMNPRSIYIALPVPPGSDMDKGFSAGGPFPGGDQTLADDGWAVASGTSSAAPQIAGVCALLRQAHPTLLPSVVKAILRASARPVVTGASAQGQPANSGLDGAAGAGLVDAFEAYTLASGARAS